MGITRFQDRWQALNDLYHEAQTLPEEEVQAFCERACGDDEELRDFILELVASARAGDENLRRSISHIARDVAAQDLLLGERVGAYRLDALLGRGGMGEVYLASRDDGQFEKQVAIKVVRRRLDDGQLASRFRTECQVLANLEHPSIPSLLDAGQLEDGRPYFVCHYVDGEPIDEFCARRDLSRGARLDLVERIGEALQFAHNNLILHLDVKPDNVLVTDDGTPMLLDFGIAQLIDEREPGGIRAFSPRYASPEQVRGERPTVAADVYALGALLYHLLAGDAPFAAPRFAPTDTVLAERDEFAQENTAARPIPGIDADLQAIVMKMLASEPTGRYRSVEAFLRDLKNYRADRPVSARRHSYPYRLGKFAKRHRVPLALTGLAFVTLVGVALREADLRRQTQAAKVVAEREAETAERVSEFLTELFRISDPGEARGNSVTARELLDEGAGRIAEELADQPLVAARLMNTMGSVYQNLGLTGDALPLHEQAVELYESAAPNEPGGLSRQLHGLGHAYIELSRYEDAEKVLLRALNLAADDPERDLGSMSRGRRSLALVFMRTGRFDEAIDLLNVAIAESDEAGNPDLVTQGRLLTLRASATRQVGQPEDAEQDFLRAIDVMSEALGEDHVEVSYALGSLGNAYVAMGRFEEAEDSFLRGLAIREKSLEPDHPMISIAHLNLGALLNNRERYFDAEEHLVRAIAIQEKSLPDDDMRLAVTRAALASSYIETDRQDKAELLLQQALATYDKKLPPTHYYVGTAKGALANVQAARGLDEEAEANYLAAIETLASQPADNPIRVDATEDYARFLRSAGRHQEAERVVAELQNEVFDLDEPPE